MSSPPGWFPQPSRCHWRRHPSAVHRGAVDESGLARLLRLQDGVVSRRQVLEHGGDDVVIERRLRRGERASMLTGVYVAHTGAPSWRQRAWAAVLYAAPAALSGAAALRAHGVRGHDEAPSVEVAIQPTRRARPVAGIVVRRLSDYHRVALGHLGPPRSSRNRTAPGRVAGSHRGPGGLGAGRWLPMAPPRRRAWRASST